MKYIVIQTRNSERQREIPIIFPKMLIHRDVYEHIARNIKFNHGELGEVKCISAGFFTFHPLECFGESESLGVKSRLEDIELIKTHDYTHGIIV